MAHSSALIHFPLPSDWRECWGFVLAQNPRPHFFLPSGVPVMFAIGKNVSDAVDWNWRNLRDAEIEQHRDWIDEHLPNRLVDIEDKTDPRYDKQATIEFVFTDLEAAMLFKMSR